MGPALLIMDQPMQGYFGPPILLGQTRKLVFNNPTPLFVRNNLNIKKMWMTLC